MTQNVTDDQVRRLNAELGLPPASAERWLHDLRADERREAASPYARFVAILADPPEPNEKLRALMRSVSPWEKRA